MKDVILERLIKYLLNFAIDNSYSVIIPNIDEDKEINEIRINLQNKSIKVN